MNLSALSLFTSNRMPPRAVLLCWLLTASAYAGLETKDSADFNYAYEASREILPDQTLYYAPSDLNWIRRDLAPELNDAHIRDGVLSLSSPAGTALYFEGRPEWWRDVTDLQRGFTVEIKLRVQSDKTFGGVQLGFSADAGTGAGLAGLVVTGDCTQWLGSGVVDIEPNDDGFHVFRIVKLPGDEFAAGAFNLYRDGVLILEEVTGADPEQTPPDRFFFGDYGSWDSAGKVEYIRWDTTGAYAPQ